MTDFHGRLPISIRGREDAFRLVESEIQREKAEALGQAGERLEDALVALETTRAAITKTEARLRAASNSSEEAASLRGTYEQLAARLAALRDRAHLAYQYLIIQREAVGMRSHLDVERCYRIAGRLR